MAADTPAAAPPASDGTVADHGSEFSKPTGTKDEEVWRRHFSDGKEAKESKPKTTADGQKPGAKSKSADDAAKPKASKPSDAATKPSPERTSDKEASKPKESKSPKKPDASEATGRKTADEKDDTPADPEAPHKKAKDLYEQAKKTEDRREARKLYKRAMTEAFGEVPEEFDDRKYAAVRTERAAAKATLDQQAQKNEGRINEATERLKPAIYVMRQLEGAGLAERLTVPMVERAVHVMRALVSLDNGDFTQLAEVVARAAGVDHDEAMKRFVRGVKVSPESRAARASAEAAERRATETERQLAELRKQLSDRDSAQTEAQKKAEHARQVEDTRTSYLESIESEIDGHPVLALPNGAKRVLAYLIKTAHPTLKTPTLSFEEAANRVVAYEKKRLQASRHLLDEGDPAPAPAGNTRRLSNVSRSETADTSVRASDPIARFNEIFDKHASAGGRRR